MNANDNEQQPRIKFRGDIYTTARRSAEAVLAHDEQWITRAFEVHRQIQEQGPTPELLKQFQDVAADYVTTNLVRLHEDGSASPFPDEIAQDISPREFSAITAAVQAAKDEQPYTPTALLQEASGVLEVQ